MNTRTNHGAIVPIERVEQLKPFTLPTPPPGMKWHREDGWTAEMLPPGKRPFFLGETSVKSNHDNPTDQVGGGKWAWGTLAKGEIATVDCKHLRTARPLLFIHSGHEWTWHRAGDPMPCGGNRYVILLGDSPSHEESEAQQGSYWLWQSPILNCIGWRYADAEKPDPYAELKKAHAEGKVIQFFSKTSGWYDCNELNPPEWTSPPERYRIKPEDSPPWIEWHGGPCPLKDEEVEEWERQYRNKTIGRGSYPSEFEWVHRGWMNDIIAYRVLKWRTPKPKVPVGPEDVPPGSVFRAPEWKPAIYVTPSLVAENGVTWIRKLLAAPSASVEYLSFEMLMAAGWQINRPRHRDQDGNPTLWEACEK